MTERLKLVAVSGGLQRPSRTLVLVEEIVTALSIAMPLDVRLIELGELAPALGRTLYRNRLPESAEMQLEAIETADVLVVASPVFRGSFSGLFKHLFDLIAHDALVDKPILLAATGGSDRHALVIEHQLRPLFAFFQALTLPVGVYASERDFNGYEISSAALHERIALAVERALPLLKARPARPVQVDTAHA
ncbi:FMN reductase [Trinickia sp. LjRoot230]|uniref:FMN reductase n=1 Tax=Trinickia sp. LjRoot230 TaxID=3342288 RepID=UPI003ECD3901